MIFLKLNNAVFWYKIKKLRTLIKQEKEFKKRTCWKCKKDLNIFDFLSDNLEYSSDQILALWQNDLLEFYCCDCFRYLKIHELKSVERQLNSRKCLNCNKSFDIYKFSKEYVGLTIEELKNLWLDQDKSVFCSRYCEKYYYRVKLRAKN